jgi:hypothetical protein
MVFGDQLTQERIEHSRIALASITGNMDKIVEGDGSWHTCVTLLEV